VQRIWGRIGFSSIPACRFILTSAAVGLYCMVLSFPVTAQERVPLLMEGKKTLFQKILTRPGAQLLKSPEAGNDQGTPVAPFSVYYAYARKKADQEWIEVGPSRKGQTVGWINASQALDWKQTLTVAFTNPAGRDRILFFRKKKTLRDLLESDALLAQTETLRNDIIAGKTGPEFPVLSIEPDTAIDAKRKFYLLPILDAEETYLSSGFAITLLNVASVSLDQSGEPDQTPTPKATETPPEPPKPPTPPALPSELSSVVTFVIDATTSMGPYIDRTRQAVDRVLRRVEKDGLTKRVKFGLVAYRDDMTGNPDLEFVSKVFAAPKDIESADDFLSRVKTLKPAGVSTKGFAEDAFAGLDMAIQKINWSDFNGRYIVLITDASARGANDPLSSTLLSPQSIRLIAESKGIHIYVLHLKTPAGKADHETAKKQYEELALKKAQNASLYYPVSAGDVSAFGRVVDQLASAITNNVLRGPDLGAQKEAVDKAQKDLENAKPEEKKEKKLALTTELLGLALQLEYLGAIKGTKAPSVFQSWIVDRDFRSPDKPSLNVNVLLSKNQLSDLQETIKRLLDALEIAQLKPDKFFDQVRGAAVAMGRDPDNLNQARTIADLGLMGEYLEGLPYLSNFMAMDQDLWLSWGIGRQQQFIDELRSKTRLYRRYHDDTDNWVLLSKNASDGDSVYPVPLEALP
jgi:serine/threonine-protein kinase PpkA